MRQSLSRRKEKSRGSAPRRPRTGARVEPLGSGGNPPDDWAAGGPCLPLPPRSLGRLPRNGHRFNFMARAQRANRRAKPSRGRTLAHAQPRGQRAAHDRARASPARSRDRQPRTRPHDRQPGTIGTIGDRVTPTDSARSRRSRARRPRRRRRRPRRARRAPSARECTRGTTRARRAAGCLRRA